jgi:hypothetical protein
MMTQLRQTRPIASTGAIRTTPHATTQTTKMTPIEPHHEQDADRESAARIQVRRGPLPSDGILAGRWDDE